MSVPTTYRLHEALGYRLTVAARRVERRFETALKTLGLTRITWCVLLAVGEEGHRHPSEIADFIGIDRTAASRALRGMEAEGLITRDDGRVDRRNTRVSLTDKGRERLARALPLAVASRNATEARLAPGDREALLTLLDKLGADDAEPLKRL
jgi:MarR family transcriptional regulator for hemolysin